MDKTNSISKNLSPSISYEPKFLDSLEFDIKKHNRALAVGNALLYLMESPEIEEYVTVTFGKKILGSVGEILSTYNGLVNNED